MSRPIKHPHLPAYHDFFCSTLKALIALGGSGTNAEINQKVYEIAGLSDELLEIPHSDGIRSQSEIDYRLGWTRSYLKYYGLILNTSRSVWALCDMNINPDDFDADVIVKTVRALSKQKTIENPNDILSSDQKASSSDLPDNAVQMEASWKESLLQVLYELSPAAFERLSQLLLRESGFSKVEVTGQVGDGGIDGKGIVSLGGLLSFPIIFQCKRYRGSVTSSQIRDFRGAMQGRADKGLVITTGTFTRSAKLEATRDGAPPIDLVDGDLLCDKLKELKLGINVELVERITVLPDWFQKI